MSLEVMHEWDERCKWVRYNVGKFFGKRLSIKFIIFDINNEFSVNFIPQINKRDYYTTDITFNHHTLSAATKEEASKFIEDNYVNLSKNLVDSTLKHLEKVHLMKEQTKGLKKIKANDLKLAIAEFVKSNPGCVKSLFLEPDRIEEAELTSPKNWKVSCKDKDGMQTIVNLTPKSKNDSIEDQVQGYVHLDNNETKISKIWLEG